MSESFFRVLANGSKDEAIARHLGVATRTVARLIAEPTETLGATGRFRARARARAAKLGLL